MNQRQRVDTAFIFAHDPELLADFYRRGLALAAPDVQQPDHIGWQLDGLYLGFDQAASSHGSDSSGNSGSGSGSGVSLWFRVPDLEQTYGRFLAAGRERALSAAAEAHGRTSGLGDRSRGQYCGVERICVRSRPGVGRASRHSRHRGGAAARPASATAGEADAGQQKDQNRDPHHHGEIEPAHVERAHSGA